MEEATTEPTAPEAETPLRATVREVVTEPTAPEAALPVSATVREVVTDPTFPVAETPVAATVLDFCACELNGAVENGASLNMDDYTGVYPAPR